MVKVTVRGKRAWVTFSIDEGEGSVMLKGSWNQWQAEPMKRKKSGGYYLTKVLPIDNRYEFGYLHANGRWQIDPELPKVDSPFGSSNSLLHL